jgi:hypothetical protein
MRPFRDFDYYHPEQKGSVSLKSVLPAVTGRSYDDLTMTYGIMSEQEKEELRADLEKYCAMDTEGMIWIVEKLYELCV